MQIRKCIIKKLKSHQQLLLFIQEFIQELLGLYYLLIINFFAVFFCRIVCVYFILNAENLEV